MLAIHSRSHLDHGLSKMHLDWLLAHYSSRTTPILETIDLPDDLPELESGIWGPLAGDPPVAEEDVVYRVRGDRPRPSRMVARPMRPTRFLTVIAGPRGREPLSLYTAFGGPLAEREPWDASLWVGSTEHQRAVEFWRRHALSLDMVAP